MLARAFNDVARELVAEAEVRRQERQGYFNLGLGGKPNLCLLGDFAQAG
jgi:hypothetical protein